MKMPRLGYGPNPQWWEDALIPLSSPKHPDSDCGRLFHGCGVGWGLQEVQGSLKVWGTHGMNKQDSKEE